MTEQTQPIKEQRFTSTLAKYDELRDQLHKAAQDILKETIKYPEKYTEQKASQAWSISAIISMHKERDQQQLIFDEEK